MFFFPRIFFVDDFLAADMSFLRLYQVQKRQENATLDERCTEYLGTNTNTKKVWGGEGTTPVTTASPEDR